MEEIKESYCALCGGYDLCVNIGSHEIYYCGKCFYGKVVPYIEKYCELDSVIVEEDILLSNWFDKIGGWEED